MPLRRPLAFASASTVATSASRSWEIRLTLGAVLGLLPLLAWGPLAFPGQPDVRSAASIEGYNTAAAFSLAFAWLLLASVVAGLIAARLESRPSSPAEPTIGSAAVPSFRRLALVAVVIAIGVVLMYFPPFLAVGGPYIEDQIHLTALHRMIGGMRPYTDFEFLYGPLMLYPMVLWTKLFGFSLVAFYSYVALLEACGYATMFVVLWRLIRDRTWRAVAVVVVGGLFLNALVGPNWSATRRLMAFVALLLLAHAPRRLAAAITGGILIGLQTAYSQDVGIAALAGAGAIYAILLTGADRWVVVRNGVLVAALAVITWYLTVRALLGDGLPDYFAEVQSLTARFSAGEAGFRFYWTVNSVALFSTLCLAAVVIGRGIWSRRAVEPTRTDLLLLGGYIFSLVSLKSGLNRSDLWHLDAGLLPVAIALLLPGARRFAAPAFLRRVSAGLLVCVSLTYVFGLLPSVSFVAAGWARGAAQWVHGGAPRTLPSQWDAPIIGEASTDSTSAAYRLATLMAAPSRRHRPVLFYADTWTLPAMIGVFKRDPINDDFLYSDERGLRARDFLEQHPDAIVLMSEEVYSRLRGDTAAAAFPEHQRRFRPTTAKRVAGWLSTTHYQGLAEEARSKDERWRRTVGTYVRERFEPTGKVERILILERRPLASTP